LTSTILLHTILSFHVRSFGPASSLDCLSPYRNRLPRSLSNRIASQRNPLRSPPPRRLFLTPEVTSTLIVTTTPSPPSGLRSLFFFFPFRANFQGSLHVCRCCSTRIAAWGGWFLFDSTNDANLPRPVGFVHEPSSVFPLHRSFLLLLSHPSPSPHPCDHMTISYSLHTTLDITCAARPIFLSASSSASSSTTATPAYPLPHSNTPPGIW